MNFFLGFTTYLRKLALCFWIGKMLFFVTIFAPRVFKVLERPDAAILQAALFPPYYTAGLICGLVILISLVATQSFGIRSLNRFEDGQAGDLFATPAAGTKQLSPRRFRLVMSLTLFALAVFAFSLWWVTPELTQLQGQLYAENPLPEAQERFKMLHKLSVQTNGAALFVLLVLLFLI
jgi:hypothetical protein